MTILGRDAKIFINDIEVTKLLAVTGFTVTVDAQSYTTGTIEFVMDGVNVEPNGDIRIGETKKETFKYAAKERSLLF